MAVLALPVTTAAGLPDQDPGPRIIDVRPRVLDVQPRIVDLARRAGQRTRIPVPADVLFAFGSAELAPQARQQLVGVVARIDRRQPTRVEIVGHTDSVGSRPDNQRLSERRAAAVRRHLQRAVTAPAPAFTTQGFGETRPVAPNTRPDGSDNPAGRAENRRVEITLVP